MSIVTIRDGPTAIPFTIALNTTDRIGDNRKTEGRYVLINTFEQMMCSQPIGER